MDNCEICAAKQTTRDDTAFGITPTPPHAWHTIGIDLLQLPATKKGYKYLLVIVDLLTRYARAVPLMDKTASLVTHALKREVFTNDLLGAPTILISDNGTEFVNSTMQKLLDAYGTTHRTTTPYNPKGNGATERLNRTVLGLLRGILHPGLDWADAIPHVLSIYNHAPHASTGMSPFEAATGRPARHPQLTPDAVRLTAREQVSPPVGPRSLLRDALQHRFGPTQNITDAWLDAEQDWNHRLAHHLQSVVAVTAENRTTRIAHANKSRADPQFNPGDVVYITNIHRPPGTDGKLSPPRTGPFIITAVHNRSHTLELEDRDGTPLQRPVPFSHAKRWSSHHATFLGGEDVTRQ
jgi:hypothetical protein